MNSRNSCFFALLTVVCCVSAEFPENLTFIGDSLSDLGNANPGFGGPAPRSDGPPWPRKLGEKFGIPIVQSAAGGTDFAFAGSLSAIDMDIIFPGPNFFPSAATQVARLPPSIRTKSPIFVFSGANDIILRNFLIIPPVDFTNDDAALNLQRIAQTLHNRHFRTLIFFNLPDIGRLPVAGNSPFDPFLNNKRALLSLQTETHNANLLVRFRELDFPVLFIDARTLFDDTLDHPTDYGFSNVTEAEPAHNTPGFLFFTDGIHPTNLGHQMIADFVYSILSAPNCFAQLAQQPLSILRQQNAAIRQQLFPAQVGHERNKYYPFLSEGYAPWPSPPHDNGCIHPKANAINLTTGFTNQISRPWTIGFALGLSYDTTKCKQTSHECNFELLTQFVNLFSTYKRPCFYIQGIANFGFLEFPNIRRKFNILAKQFNPKGNTLGIQYGESTQGVYLISTQGQSFFTGPMFQLDLQQVFVYGYREKGGEFTNIRYKNQKDLSFISGFGWEAFFKSDGGKFTTAAFLSANVDWIHQTREILFRQKSVQGIYGSWPIVQKQTWFGSGGINFSVKTDLPLIFSIGYLANFGQNHMQEHFLTFSQTI